jgi:hypothetical protein
VFGEAKELNATSTEGGPSPLQQRGYVKSVYLKKENSRMSDLRTRFVPAVLFLLCSTFAAAQSYKYQIVDIPGTLMSQPSTAAVKVDSAETQFTITTFAMGRPTTVKGTIENGVYKPSGGGGNSPFMRVENITSHLTKDWLPVNAEPGTTCVVAFKSNYDKQADATAKYASGDIILGPRLQRFGYNFSGYYYDPAATKPVRLDAAARGDVTVYAGWEKWDPETQHYEDMYQSLMDQGQYIMERPTAYEEKSFTKFYEVAFFAYLRFGAGGQLVTKDSVGVINSAFAAMKEVVQVSDPAKAAWPIWGDKMATEDGTDKFEFFGYLDDPKWRPFLVPYMLKDQSKVKANIIVVAGGGYLLRSNIEEAYSTAKVMNGLGYNCFVLQRRVSPYAPIDSALDLQRSVRYLKYHAKEYGIAQIDKIATSGFSGGGGTITTAAAKYYGNILPSSQYASYTDDDIDKLNSDVQAMLVIYSSGQVNPENKNYPAVFLAFGTLDGLSESAPVYYKDLKAHGIFAEIHGFAGAPHGFGAGTGIPDYAGTRPMGFGASTNQNKADYAGASKPYLLAYTGAQQWTELADTFLEEVFKYKPVTY